MPEVDSEVWVGREGVGELKKGGERGGGGGTIEISNTGSSGDTGC